MVIQSLYYKRTFLRQTLKSLVDTFRQRESVSVHSLCQDFWMAQTHRTSSWSPSVQRLLTQSICYRELNLANSLRERRPTHVLRSMKRHCLCLISALLIKRKIKNESLSFDLRTWPVFVCIALLGDSILRFSPIFSATFGEWYSLNSMQTSTIRRSRHRSGRDHLIGPLYHANNQWAACCLIIECNRFVAIRQCKRFACFPCVQVCFSMKSFHCQCNVLHMCNAA